MLSRLLPQPFQSGDNNILREMKCALGSLHVAAAGSCEPNDLRAFTSRVIAVLHPEHLQHLILLSCDGCRRGYTHERYRNIIHNIRRYMPDASISGDAIVGYPGTLCWKDMLLLGADKGP